MCLDEVVTSPGQHAHGSPLPIVVVDAANVVGSVPDGWWRDRRGATERLRDRIAARAASGLAVVPGPVRLIMVVEGQARGICSRETVEVVEAPGSGDDTIVEVVAGHQGSPIVVVTADRGLTARVRALGAQVVGPSALRD